MFISWRVYIIRPKEASIRGFISRETIVEVVVVHNFGIKVLRVGITSISLIGRVSLVGPF